MELAIAEVISELDPAFYVIECLPNILTPEEITERTIPLVKTIREKRPETPIIFVENFNTNHQFWIKTWTRTLSQSIQR